MEFWRRNLSGFEVLGCSNRHTGGFKQFFDSGEFFKNFMLVVHCTVILVKKGKKVLLGIPVVLPGATPSHGFGN
jgi:hypothetical protein